MGTITATSIIGKAKLLLQDTTNVRWSDAELLGWLNDGQREVAMIRPDACSRIAPVALVAGTRQTLPSDGTSVIKVVRNMGADGATPGRAIRQVPMDLLDSNVPNWHAAAASAETLHFMSDPRMPHTFYVYPPAVAGRRVELVYAAPPTDVAALGDPISVDDVFSNPLIDYVAFRAYSKDQDLVGNVERATAHRQLFLNVISGKSQSDASVGAPQINVKG